MDGGPDIDRVRPEMFGIAAVKVNGNRWGRKHEDQNPKFEGSSKSKLQSAGSPVVVRLI